jgi:hypothetical protein
MSFAADDHEAIRRRLEELAAERQLALTGSTVPDAKVGDYAMGWPAIEDVYG